jgi:hypothetical protein
MLINRQFRFIGSGDFLAAKKIKEEVNNLSYAKFQFINPAIYGGGKCKPNQP